MSTTGLHTPLSVVTAAGDTEVSLAASATLAGTDVTGAWETADPPEGVVWAYPQ